MRILILSQFFDPEPTLKGLAFAQSLVADGHDVEVLTGFPNYPGGKVYFGYKIRLWSSETIGGVKIKRVALYPSHDRSVLKRALNYLSFAFSASILGPWLVQKPDILYVYHPPLTTTLPAAILKGLYHCPAVLDVQDLWPDTLGSTGMVRHPLLLGLVGKWAKLAYRLADKIVVLSPGFRERLLTRGVPADKLRLIFNWNEESRQPIAEPNQAFAMENGLNDRFNIVYAGSLGPAQALDNVLDAAKICKKQCPSVQMVLIGRGIDEVRLKARVKDEDLTNVVFVPQQSMQAMASIFPLANALLVNSKDDPLFAITIPSKTQAYLAAGRPIIIAANGDAADLVRESGAGLVIPPEKPIALVVAIQRLLSMREYQRADLAESGREFYAKELSMAIGVRKFEDIFEELKANREEVMPTIGHRSLYARFGKRVLDLAIVVPSLILLTPLFLIVSLISGYQLGWPVTFRQLRAGRNGKVFNIFKFRSMSSECDGQGELLPDSLRTSKYGAFLRRLSIDELPGLFNVLKGQMSLVGPRPLLPEYLPYYSPDHARRHDVRPGITGVAQLNGRQLATFKERMEMDVWYVDNVSLLTDIKLLLKTIPKVLGVRGVVNGQDVRDVDDLGLSRESRERFAKSGANLNDA